MISISCLESKLLNNNNWYGRFQLAPFQKGEGLTVANSLRRTLLAEKRAFFITWVDFYNAEIPYSVLTGMRESIFDILLNLKQVIFTSDKILPNNNHFFKMRSNNNSKAQKIKKAFEPSLLNESINIVLPMTKQKKISCFPAEPFNKLNGSAGKHDHVYNLNYKRVTTQNVFSENQILGKIINSKNETRLRIFHKYKNSKNQFLDTSNPVSLQTSIPFDYHQKESSRVYGNINKAALRIPEKTNDSTYIGYICAKGPATIYAKNIKLPKGLKCVDPDKYITTLADDGLFYLRFAVTTKIQTSSLMDRPNISNRINQSIKFNYVRFQTFPKTLFNKEIQSCFNSKIDPLILNREKKSKKSGSAYRFTPHLFWGWNPNQYYLNSSRTPFLESHLKSLRSVKQETQANNYYKQKYPLFFFKPYNAKSRRKIQHRSYTELQDFKEWSVHGTKNLINEQCLVLTNDSIKQFNFQNTSIIANIQKTCLLNIQIKHYYYKCGRFDRFLFDLIKGSAGKGSVGKLFKANLISSYYKKPCLKNNKNIFNQDGTVLTHFQKIFERQKSNSYLLIDYNQNNVRKAFFLKKKHFMRGSARADKLSNRFSLQSHVKSFKLKFQTPHANILESYWSGSACGFTEREAMGWNPKNKYQHLWNRCTSSSIKWQKIFQSLRTSSIYDYLQKLNTSQATRIYYLLTNSNPESKILLLGSQLILNNDSQTTWLSNTLASICKIASPENRYFKSDIFSFDNLWQKKENGSAGKQSSAGKQGSAGKQESQFLFQEFIGLPVNKLTGGPQIQENSNLTMDNKQIHSSVLSIFRLQELYIKKFLNVCFLFQCSKNYILYFLKFYILQNNHSPDFLNKNPVHLKNIVCYSPFKFGSIYTEKLITKIKFLRQWLFLCFEHKKQTNISLLNKKTDPNFIFKWEGTSLFSWFNNLFLIRPIKLEFLYLNQNKTSKYDIHVREFFYSGFSYRFTPRETMGRKPKNSLLRVQKTGFLFTSNKYPSINSVQISTNLRAKPSISIQQVSYKPVWILLSIVEKNIDKLSLWFDHLNFGGPKQTLTNNSVIVKPIYLNIEQIIYILKQTTKFRKNQRINPIFFNSLIRLKMKNRYPLDYSFLFSKVFTFLYNSFYKRYLFNHRVSSYFGFGFFEKKKTRLYFFSKNLKFSKRKVESGPLSFKNEVAVGRINDLPINAKTQMCNTNSIHRPVSCHVGVLGNDFLFKMPPLENNFSYTTSKSQNNWQWNFLLPYRKDKAGSACCFTPRETMGWNPKLFSLSKEPYNINICHSIISFNLRYTYPFKFTIFETFLPFLNFSGNLQTHWKTSNKVWYSPKNSHLAFLKWLGRKTIKANNFFSVQKSKASISFHSFDHIQYNESFKIYTNLAYTCLKTYEPHLLKYHNFNRRNQKQFKMAPLENNNRKILSFQLESAPAGIQDWALFQALPVVLLQTYFDGGSKKNKDWIIAEADAKNRKSYYEKFNVYPSLIKADQLSSIFNSSYKWRIMNTSNFNDAFITIPCTWFLNFQLYGSQNFKNLFDSFVSPLQKLFYIDYVFQTKIVDFHSTILPIVVSERNNDAAPPVVLLSAERWDGTQNKNEKVLFESFGDKKEIIKNRLHWLKTTIITNELTWLRSYKEKKTKKNLYDFKVNNKNSDKESTYNFIGPQASILFENKRGGVYGNLNRGTLRMPKKTSFLSTLEENSNFNVRRPTVSWRGVSWRGVSWRGVSWRGVSWRGVSWRDLSKFKIKKSIKKLAMNFENIYYKNLLWNSRKITLRILNNAILPLVTNRKYSISHFLPFNELSKMYNDRKLPFYSLRHKVLGTTNFLCSKSYPIFINENENGSAGKQKILKPTATSFLNDRRPDSSIEIHKESVFENNFLHTNASSFYNAKGKQANFISGDKPVLREKKSNERYTQRSDDLFSESFLSLRSKWRPFFIGSLRNSQEKKVSSGSSFINFATRPKQLNQNNERPRLETDFKIKSPLMNNLWSSLVFCRYSLYAISTLSDLFFQNLINNENWTPSTNKLEIPQINSRNYIKNLHGSLRAEKFFFRNPQISIPFDNNQKEPGRIYEMAPPENINKDASNANNKMQLQYEQSNIHQFLHVKPSLKSYYETIQKIKYQNYKSTNYIVPNYVYYWQKAVHVIILSRFQISKFNNERKKVGFNRYKNLDEDDLIPSLFLQYRRVQSSATKNPVGADSISQNSLSELKNRYSMRGLKNSERYFGNPLRQHISQNGLSFCNISLPIKLYKKLITPRRGGFKKANTQIKSWKSIIGSVKADIYFCFRYPLFIQNCNLPWQKSKRVFGMQKHWLNKRKIDLKALSVRVEPQKLTGDTYLSNGGNINVAPNTQLVMTYTQLSSSSTKTHQPLLHSKLWANTISPVHMHLQTQGSYGMIGYFSIQESLNSIYKVNYIVESQASESKSISARAEPRKLAFDSDQNNRFLKPQNSIENSHNLKIFDNVQRDSVNTDSLTVSNFLNATYSFVPSKTILLNSSNELMNSQMTTSKVENENEYIQIDIWTNGELSPRQALLNAFRKLFELFYNLSKYNCLKPIEI